MQANHLVHLLLYPIKAINIIVYPTSSDTTAYFFGQNSPEIHLFTISSDASGWSYGTMCPPA